MPIRSMTSCASAAITHEKSKHDLYIKPFKLKTFIGSLGTTILQLQLSSIVDLHVILMELSSPLPMRMERSFLRQIGLQDQLWMDVNGC
uniref:Uncharacterized protein n=1 Tax=Solanum lycopersicum TaxID=4081 RepID=A0A3Q7HEK0_SOLLC